MWVVKMRGLSHPRHRSVPRSDYLKGSRGRVGKPQRCPEDDCWLGDKPGPSERKVRHLASDVLGRCCIVDESARRRVELGGVVP